MYYEERLIDGLMCFRTTPDGIFKPMTIKMLSLLYADLKGELIALKMSKEE